MNCLTLNGLWEMKKYQDQEWLSATIPGTMYGTYLHHDQIKDPLVGENDKALTSLSDNDFIFRRTFLVDQDFLDEDKIELVCKGLDTLATIRLNGVVIGITNNMHRTYRLQVKEILKEGDNEISILFQSPTRYIEQQQAKFPLWGILTTMPGYEHIRKGHHMFGWDWGPQLPDVGIWRDIELNGYTKGKIEDIMISQTHSPQKVQLNLTMETQLFGDAKGQLEIAVFKDDGELLGQYRCLAENQSTLEVVIENPQLWWPNGYGKQPLYKIVVDLIVDGLLRDSVTKKIGLRTLKINREKDQWGESFYFEVNQVGIFGMGGNYIPEDIIITRPTKMDTERLIKDCVEAHFNCLRVWGGGVYPNDDFLDLCDTYGIIIWQDFMFACGVYRMTDAFVETIKEEFIDNIKRLRHHPCLGLWCGNNEMEWGMVEWGMPKDERFRFDYMTLYERIIPSVLEIHDPSTSYWPASPSSGGGFDNPNSEHKGDVHYWSVFHGNEHYKKYRDHYFRFLSEYGMQSLPDIKTVKSFAKTEELSLFNPVMENHNKCIEPVNGNIKVLFNMVMELPEPKDFYQTVYGSQVFHGEALKCAVEHMRRNRGRCMGSTYWQVNDNYTAISWSSIDYYGRWKAPHYYAKRFYAPVLISGYENKDQVYIHVTNDKMEGFEGRAEIQLRHIEKGVIWTESLNVNMKPLSTTIIATVDTEGLFSGVDGQRNIFVSYQLYDEKNDMIGDSSLTLCPYKFFHFKQSQIDVKIMGDDKKGKIILKSPTYVKALGIQFKTLDAKFSDNYFDLLPDCERIIDFQVLGEWKEEALLGNDLEITCINDLVGPNISMEDYHDNPTIF